MIHCLTALKRGEYHLNQCEDHLLQTEIGSDFTLYAVMDGCTNGIESHFAATLFGKLLRKTAHETGYKLFVQSTEQTPEAEHLLEQVITELFFELGRVKQQLMLHEKEMLSTLTLFILKRSDLSGAMLVLGDGVVSINGQLMEFDQENTPDYPVFHLKEDVKQWFAGQQSKMSIPRVRDVAIATDGILSFTAISKGAESDFQDPVVYLLQESVTTDPDWMEKQLKQLEYTFGLVPTDDLAVVRIVCT